MTKFDFLSHIAFRFQESLKVNAQIQNTTDHGFYEDDETYQEPWNSLVENQSDQDGPQYEPPERNDISKFRTDKFSTDKFSTDKFRTDKFSTNEEDENDDGDEESLPMADVGEYGVRGVWESGEGSPSCRASVNVKVSKSRTYLNATVSIMHPEKYEDWPGYTESPMATNFPGQVINEQEGQDDERHFDMDELGPSRGRPSTMLPGLSSDGLEGEFGEGDHDLDGDTSNGFNNIEIEADYGWNVSTISGPSKEDTDLNTSPNDVTEWIGKGASKLLKFSHKKV